MKIRIIILLSSLILFTSCATNQNVYKPSEKEVEELTWAKRVCLSAEYGYSANRILKWNHPVRISVIKGNISQDVIEIVKDINIILRDTTVSVELLNSPDTTADIELYFTEMENFPSIARKNHFTYVDGNWGYFYCFWNKNYELRKAYVFIATDKLNGTQLKHFTLEEIVQSFGLMNDSRTFTDSIFFSGNEYDFEIDTLSIKDRKLIYLIYKYLDSGSTKKQFDDVFYKHWNEIVFD